MAALCQHMQAHPANMLIGLEILGIIYFVAFYLKFQQSEIVNPHTVTTAQVLAYHARPLNQHRHHRTS